MSMRLMNDIVDKVLCWKQTLKTWFFFSQIRWSCSKKVVWDMKHMWGSTFFLCFMYSLCQMAVLVAVAPLFAAEMKCIRCLCASMVFSALFIVEKGLTIKWFSGHNHFKDFSNHSTGTILRCFVKNVTLSDSYPCYNNPFHNVLAIPELGKSISYT